MIGAQTPRILVLPDGEEHSQWSEVLDFVDQLGVTLDEWQWAVLHAALLRSGDVWAAFAVAVCCPRQNGKNGILEVRELIGPLILGEKLLIHSAHLADTSKEHFRRLDDLIDANDWLSSQVKHIWRTNGHESIEFKGGKRIRFRTRTKGGGRGFAGAPVVFDEAMFLPEVSMGSILPVASAQPDPQIWYMGSAVDQTIMEDGVVFARVRERALKGDHDRLAYFEYSLDADLPENVTEEQAADPKVWADANPAYGVRIMEDYIRAERGELAPRTFAVERLGVWDPPPLTRGERPVIDIEAWDALYDVDSVAQEPFCFAFDVAPSRTSAAIAVAGQRTDGLAHVEVGEHRKGVGWVVGRLVELKAKHPDATFFCAARSPAAALLKALEEREVSVETTDLGEYVQACGMLYDGVEQGTLRHLGTDELRFALKGARTRQVSESWVWSRRNSTVDVTPLVAVTHALWGGAQERPSRYEDRDLLTV